MEQIILTNTVHGFEHVTCVEYESLEAFNRVLSGALNNLERRIGNVNNATEFWERHAEIARADYDNTVLTIGGAKIHLVDILINEENVKTMLANDWFYSKLAA